MRAIVLANRSDCDLGLVGTSLRARGYSFIEYLREDHQRWLPTPSGPERQQALDKALSEVELVVALGSGWSTYWPGVSEPVAAEASLLQETHRRQIPLLGICFGAQMLSTALGGTVEKAPRPEIGWYDIAPTAIGGPTEPATGATTGTGPLPAVLVGPWMQWHYDRFSVPDGFSLLAQSSVGPQIVCRDRSVGVQFHPEATETIVARWSEGTGVEELAAQGVDPVELLARTRDEMANAPRRCGALVDWFFDVID